MDHKKLGSLFIVLGLSSLLIGLFFGSIGGLQYILPPFLKEQLSFQKTRPLHVYLVINFIFSTAAGCIYYFLPAATGKKLYSLKLGIIQFSLQLFIFTFLLLCFRLTSPHGPRGGGDFDPSGGTPPHPPPGPRTPRPGGVFFSS